MKAALVLLAIAMAAPMVALAHCPNSCSGHGTCGQYDKCTCWANWEGNDCSERTCHFGNAWAVDNVDPHYYAECSNKGICDRATGDCQCFPEFEGRACERMSCPNSCSGHGKCRYITDLTNAATYAGWDATKIQTCVCDGGYYGPDCSQRYCPYGDDPLTVCNTNNYHIQLLQITFDTTLYGSGAADVWWQRGKVDNQELALKFVDSYGELWRTQKISSVWDNSTSAANIKTALEALPNHVLPGVDVNVGTIDDNSQKQWLLTFNNQYTTGTQNMVECNDVPLGCPVAGCQPKYKQMRIVDHYIDDYTNINEVQITADSVFATTNTGAERAASDINITIIVHANASTEQYTPYDEVSPEKSPGGVAANIWHSYSTLISTDGGANANLEGGFRGVIPIDYEKVYIGRGMYVRFNTREPDPGTYAFAVSVPYCSTSVSTAASATRENVACSNRGECDEATGNCACYDGFYGLNCNAQTILV